MTIDSQEPPAAAMTFEILKAAVRDAPTAARLGRLALAGRRTVETPNSFANTSRGVVPHLTPDNVNKHMHGVGGTYMGLEDFIERPQIYTQRSPPIYDTPPASPALHHRRALHSFTAMPSSIITVMGARRLPAVPAPTGNTNTTMSVFTSTGFQLLSTKEYMHAVDALRPDIVIPMADLTDKAITPTSKRAVRMAERTDEWVTDWFRQLPSASDPDLPPTATFAPVLPIPYSMQWEYLERLSEDYAPTSQLSGLALYDADVLPDLTSSYANLAPLPRLSLSAPATPHHILRQISLGVDLFVLPFLNAVSDSGLALTFTFPPPPPLPSSSSLLPLGIDLSHPSNATSLTPLLDSCPCYACTSHHRAFITHLLSAREMLGWTLLQTHNHAVLASFFAGVRTALAAGPEAYQDACRKFSAAYEPELPAGTGEKPRARGYQFRTEGAAPAKKNKPAWGKLGADFLVDGEKQDKEKVVDSGAAAADAEIEVVALQTSPHDVDALADKLAQKGFAEVAN
ncbi:tRNA-guanine(15) transglycosylase-like protein [Podospora didyma]|uniref:Queuine tRNA-ribosyltransferase accessory subunit 2 n=1 Tax=Podospora didyma TaxID=330526 RepID=A0AAE0NCP1_9PEZI|nr:tRNA-guanine(15) transglycosylase-like protein [Podospora didyma]